MNIFIFGIDGLGRGVLEHQPKNISGLLKKSTLYSNMYTVFESSSAQAWGSLMLSVSPDKHGYTNSMIGEYTHELDEYPSVFRIISENLKNYELYSISNWNPINTGILENVDGLIKKTADCDEEITDIVIECINSMGNDSLMFVQLDEVDAAGHTYDYFTEGFYKEFDRIDGYIGKMLEAIEGSGKMESSIIFIMTDHGGGTKRKSHGTDGIKDMGIFTIAYGKSFEKGSVKNETTSIMDISPTILKELNIEVPSHFEGVVLD